MDLVQVVKRPNPLLISPDNMALATDLYELTMAAGYHQAGLEGQFTFELSIRDLPPSRSFLLAAGLEQGVHFLLNFRFDDRALGYLRSHPSFSNISEAFFDHLSTLRFTGDLYAMEEGTVFFPSEPVLAVIAPPVEAQICETYLLSTISFQTAVASKAARVVAAAGGRSVVDFGSRRAHGPQAGILAARASYIAGCDGTSNVLAASELRIPAVGTAAHSWTMAFDTEEQAFAAYHRAFPDSTILLIDTYDTIEGAKRAAKIGKALKGVRLDSGDIASLSRQVRRVFDEQGLTAVKIVASGDLNEYKISKLLASGGAVDIFGVGTDMVTSKDAPALSAVYKLVERRQGRNVTPVIKLSDEKQTFPGAKQIYRVRGADGRFEKDIITCCDESPPQGGEPLLKKIIGKGELCNHLAPLDTIRNHAHEQLKALPRWLTALHRERDYPVEHSQPLINLQRDAVQRLSAGRKEA